MRLRTSTPLLAMCLGAAIAAGATGCEGPQARAAFSVAPDVASAAAKARSGLRANNNATSGDLLYVSDYQANTVRVFSYPTAAKVGTLSGFENPAGLCVDKAGDIFVTNSGVQDIVEFSHGGWTPIAVISDSRFIPFGCSVDVNSGDLAVTGYESVSHFDGSVAVYKNAAGMPTLYEYRGVSEYFFCAYDDNGDLFADGLDSASGDSLLLELPKGGHKLRRVLFKHPRAFEDGIQWDGGDLVIGNAASVYDVRVSGKTGRVIHSTELRGTKNVAQFWLQDRTIIAPDGTKGIVKFWKFPSAGRHATKIMRGFEDPFGVVVSVGT
jgi:hypothetical protein